MGEPISAFQLRNNDADPLARITEHDHGSSKRNVGRCDGKTPSSKDINKSNSNQSRTTHFDEQTSTKWPAGAHTSGKSRVTDVDRSSLDEQQQCIFTHARGVPSESSPITSTGPSNMNIHPSPRGDWREFFNQDTLDPAQKRAIESLQRRHNLHKRTFVFALPPKGSGDSSITRMTGTPSGMSVNHKRPSKGSQNPSDISVKIKRQQASGSSTVRRALQAMAKVEPTNLSAPWLALGSDKPNHGTGMIKQPQASPLPTPQLAAEIKGIYAGLVMVEAKCINIDANQMRNPTSQLTPEQWQALIALHRTLLYEQHDFHMATQHPSANDIIRSLALKYSMPARMWRHGIHQFLELLRHRRPASQEYMLAFIYLAYQMIGLMYETVPAFKDTWIECLGDLARYRMAIEGDEDLHTLWSGVAATWYNLGSQGQPSVGRLYHHLGILERPGIHKIFLYAKALTSVDAFPGARDSLTNFCQPIVRDSNVLTNIGSPSEAAIIHFHAHVYLAFDRRTAERLCADTIAIIGKTPAANLKQTGVFLIATNIAAIFEFGSTTNALGREFGSAVSRDAQHSRPELTVTTSPSTEQRALGSSSAHPLVVDFCYLTFDALMSHQADRSEVHNLLPSVHATLAWLYSLTCFPAPVFDGPTTYTLLGHAFFDWTSLASYLNKLLQTERLEPCTIQYAHQCIFPGLLDVKVQLLPEDRYLHGFLWTYFNFPQGWFDQLDSEEWRREDQNTHKRRVIRVQWLAMMIAKGIDYLVFNADTKQFSAPNPADSPSTPSAKEENDTMAASYSTELISDYSSSNAFSEDSDSDDYMHVSSWG